jgi:AcrR family transcriptional regulator
MTERLGRQDWVVAGLRALAKDGIDGVRVERLASALSVTKGSFYWHFKDRGELLAAVLEAWKARATGDVIVQVNAAGGGARERLHRLLLIVFAADGRLEQQMRAWASHDGAARAAQDEIDRLRVGYVAALFRDLGFTKAEAQARAHFAYQALIGHFAMGGASGGRAAAKRQLDRAFAMLVRPV